MATSETTNLQLVKYGAGTDNFIRTDYNGNLDKIDTFAGNTNQAIANIGKRTLLSSGDFNSLTVSIGAENKYYYGASIQSMTNAPTGTTGSWSLDVIDMNSYCVQQLSVYGVQAVHLYQRQQYWNGSAKTWGPWQEFESKSTTVPYTDITTTSGACVVQYPTGMSSTSHTYILQPLYRSGNLLGWAHQLQMQPSQINLYVRVGGDTPADNSKVTFNLICIKN